MKELTRIWTVELTEIDKANDEVIEELLNKYTKHRIMQGITNEVKNLGFDDVHVINIQDFVKDVKENEENSDESMNDPLRTVALLIDELLKNTIDIPGVSVCANFRDNSISIFVSRDEEEEDD